MAVGGAALHFDHQRRQGDIQFAYATPVLYRAPGQAVIWCFAMRCPIAYRNSEESQLAGAFTALGLKPGDRIERIDGTPLRGINAVERTSDAGGSRMRGS